MNNEGILYLGLHHQLIKKFGVNSHITRKDFFSKLGKHYLIPKYLRHQILREMEDRKLIKKVNRDTVKIMEYKEKDYPFENEPL